MICAYEMLTVLVIHEMDPENSLAYQSLSKALLLNNRKAQLFIYDNSSSPHTLPVNPLWTITYQHDPSNPGVSRAYNQAFIAAKERDMQWMLFADQDTAFPENIYERYTYAVTSHNDCDVFAPHLIDSKGIISPFHRGITSGKRLIQVVTGKKSILQYQAINSGLLVSTHIFQAVGGYDERLRLDFSDFDFFNRLQQHSSNIVFLDSHCKHEHSSTMPTTQDNAIDRFKIYLDAITIMQVGPFGFMFPVRAFLRALKLSFQYRSFRFIGTYLLR